MKKLYEVTIRMYVMAKHEMDARDVAIREAGYEMCDIDVHEASSYSPKWKGAIPFGSDDDKTVDQIICDFSAGSVLVRRRKLMEIDGWQAAEIEEQKKMKKAKRVEQFISVEDLLAAVLGKKYEVVRLNVLVDGHKIAYEAWVLKLQPD